MLGSPGAPKGMWKSAPPGLWAHVAPPARWARRAVGPVRPAAARRIASWRAPRVRDLVVAQATRAHKVVLAPGGLRVGGDR